MKSVVGIFEAFYPEALVASIEQLGDGHINSTYRVDFNIGGVSESVVLQQVNRNIFPEPAKIAENIKVVAGHLQQRNYRYEILEIKSDYLDNVGHYWRIFPLFTDCVSFLTCSDIYKAEESARAFGHHFYCLSDLDVDKLHTIIPDFHNAYRRWEQFEFAIFNADVKRRDVAQQAIAFYTENRYLIDFYTELIVQLPLRTTHNDTKISNLLFNKFGDKPSVIIDLDTLQPGTVLSEFGDMVRSYCPSHSEEETNFELINFRSDIFQALKNGFLAETESVLTAAEKLSLDHAGAITIFVQGIRFLTDYLNGDVYYRCSYEGQNLQRALNQKRLLEKLMQWQQAYL